MRKRPHKNIRAGSNQKAVYTCKFCGKAFLEEPQPVNPPQFCCEAHEKRYENQQKPDIDESPLKGGKDLLK